MSELTEEERGFVETALAAADAGDAGHWPTVATYLATEVRRLHALEAARPTREQIAEAAVRGIRFNLPVDEFGQPKRLHEYSLIWGNAAAINVLALLNGSGS